MTVDPSTKIISARTVGAFRTWVCVFETFNTLNLGLLLTFGLITIVVRIRNQCLRPMNCQLSGSLCRMDKSGMFHSGQVVDAEGRARGLALRLALRCDRKEQCTMGDPGITTNLI